jgi:hypothetical protein
VKKYADGSLHFTQTMVIENIGNKAVTEDFAVRGTFGSSRQNPSPSRMILLPGKTSPTT